MDVFAIATQKPITCKPTEILGNAVVTMSSKKFRRLPVVVDEQLVGILTANDVLNALKNEGLECLKNPVKQYMVLDPIAVTKETPLGEATTIMFEHGFGGLPIVSDYETYILVGIITERDLVKEFVHKIVDANLSDFVAEPITVNFSRSKLRKVIEKMTEERTSRVILTGSKNSLKGIISSSDILKLVADKYIREQLEEDILNLPAKELAATKLVTANINWSVKEVADLLTKYNFGGVPVVDDNGNLVGIFSERDLLQIIGLYGLF
ncbi:MAG: CBS domain-containing protein [Methanobacteriota archaeon]|nr:MAG: CBS domain-containing protein [Euryarchaeota archaeon]